LVSESARRYEEALGKASARDFQPVKDAASLNKLVYQTERKLPMNRASWPALVSTSDLRAGLLHGLWRKNDPRVREAIEQKQWNEVEPQMKKAAAALQSMASQIDAAARMLEGR
jgi:hypothetical protein